MRQNRTEGQTSTSTRRFGESLAYAGTEGHGKCRVSRTPTERVHLSPAAGQISDYLDNAMKRLLVCFLVCIAAAFTSTLVSSSPVFADQFLKWDEGGDTQVPVFGPNSAVTIYQGSIDFVRGCPVGGVDDGFWPWADVYVVPAGSVEDGTKLIDDQGNSMDRSGRHNTVMGTSQGGLFIEETIGFTKPDGAIGTGKYAVVYDECQDGRFDATYDKVFDPAFRVNVPADIPQLPSSIGKIKADAAAQKESWENMHTAYEWLFQASDLLKVAGKVWACGWDDLAINLLRFDGGPSSVFTCDTGDKHFLVANLQIAGLVAKAAEFGMGWMTGANPKKMTLQNIQNNAGHYAGIAADPPDPQFRQLTPLEAREVIDPVSGDRLDIAAADVGTAASSQERLLEAFLHSLERYQGAAAEGDGDWALIHARAVRNYADALTEQLPMTDAALSTMDYTLSTDQRPFEEVTTAWEEYRSRVASEGFTPDELREARNLGLTEAEIADLQAAVLETEPSGYTNDDVLSLHQTIRDRNATLAADLEAFSADMDVIISTLEAEPNVSDAAPVANAGRVYTGEEGEPISFSGSATGKNVIEKYEWDLDSDGSFDDATGATPTRIYHRAFRGFVGLKVTDTAGLANVAYAPVSVGEANRPPRIILVGPGDRALSVVTGMSQQFGVKASDPDGDAVAIRWYVDDSAVSESEVFEYEPQDADVGAHNVRVVVSDDDARGGSVSMSWVTYVVKPDTDGDNYRANVDCDDYDSDVNPGKTEVIGNEKDDDCNGATLDRPNVAMVTKTEDTNDGACDSDCSLREAITHANSHPNGAEPDKISFDIPGEGVKRISPTTALPTITDPVIIDGYTQPGASENTKAVGNDAVLKIELNGSKAEYGADGLTITSGDSTVRGLVINGFSTAFVSRGILIKTKGNNVIEGNRIGTNADGTDSSPALANYVGLLIQGAPNNAIGGTTPGARNVITSNASYNVRIENSSASGNKIQGNYIGTNADGSAPIYRGFDQTNSNFGFSYAYYGVAIVEAPDSIIGGTEQGAGNVISGNKFHNVLINGAGATGARIQGNYIGTDATGTADLQDPSQSYNVKRPTSGVEIEHAPNILVGGTSSAARNIISGNGDGLVLDGGTGRVSGTKVQGNYIGTDVTGTKDLGNAGISVYVFSSTNNTIGGTEPGARNVISGTGYPGSGFGDGVVIGEPNSRGNRVQGNYIGTDATGTKDLGSNNHGVVIRDGANNNFVGGTEQGAGNVISGNDLDGVYIERGTLNATVHDGNKVQGNYIGTDAAGTADLGNGKNGVVLVDGSPNNVVGGTAEGAGNTIAFNDRGGVEVAKDSSTRSNSILANSIFSNGGLGIDLDPNGTALVRDRSDDVTFNDDDDLDTGPNNYQNFPELTSARSGKAGTRIEGKLDSTPNTTFTVQFFYGPETNPSGHGEGKTYLNEKTDVTTDASGDASFAFETTAVVPVGRFVTATTTSPGDGTSEFSKAVTVEPANSAPVAHDQEISIDENTERLVTLSASDGDDDGLTYEITALPTRGKLYDGTSTMESSEITRVGAILSGSEATYVPDENFHGDDSFGFLANDGTEDSNEAIVSISVAAVNDAPTVVLTGPDVANEGDTANYSFVVDDPDSGDAFALKSGFPDCGTGGELVDGSLSTTAIGGNFDCRFPDDSTGSAVKVQVIDDQGADSNIATKNVTIANGKPVVVAPTDSSVAEGTSESFALGSFSDAGTNDGPWQVRVAWDDGSPPHEFSTSSQGNFGAAPHVYHDDGTYTVTVSVTDKDSDTGSATFKVNVSNANPTADLGNDSPISEGGSATVSFTTPSDPSSADTSAGFHYAFACGNSSLAGATYAGSGSATTKRCTFNDDTDGPFTVRARIIDKDGGYTERTTTVAVTNVAPHITSFTGSSYFYGPLSFLSNTASASKFNAAWTDNGTDTWTALLTYPDGSPLTQMLSGLTTRSFSDVGHTFASAGCKSTSLKVTDDDGGSHTATTTTNIGTGSFQPPMTNQPVTDKLKNGQVLPVKVKFTDCNGAPLTNLTPAIRLVQGDQTPQSDDSTTTITPGSVSAADTLGIMRSNGDGSYIYNLNVNITLNKDYTIVVYPYGTDDPRKLGHVIQATK